MMRGEGHKSKRNDEIDLEEESKRMFPLVVELQRLLSNEAVFVGAYICAYLCLRSPSGVVCGKRPSPLVDVALVKERGDAPLCEFPQLFAAFGGAEYVKKRKLSANIGVIELLNGFVLNKLSAIAANSIVEWFCERRRFVLCYHIPSPLEVLQQQSRGQRVVTLMKHQQELATRHKNLLSYMENGDLMHLRDSLEFLLHDLQHMEHFAGSESYLEQVGFFHALTKLKPDTKLFFEKWFPQGFSFFFFELFICLWEKKEQ